MTTVGYGDKTPKSIPGRIFSIVWVSIGIVACSLLTGMVYSEVTNVNSPPPPTMDGKKTGALLYRDYDHIMTVKNGGMVVQNEESETVDFTQDVVNLLSKLKRGDIDGFVLDETTLGFTIMHIDNTIRNTETDPELIELWKFFNEKVIGAPVAQKT